MPNSEYKLRVLTELELGNPLPAEIANQYGIHNHKLNIWAKEHRRVSPNPHSLENDIMQLQQHQMRLAKI